MIFSAQLYTKIDKIKLIKANKENLCRHPLFPDQKAIVNTEKVFRNDRDESYLLVIDLGMRCYKLYKDPRLE